MYAIAKKLNPPRPHAGLCKVLLGTAISACILWSLCTQRDSIVEQWNRQTSLTLFFGLSAAVIYRIINSMGWWFVLRSQAQSLPFWKSVRIWLVAETCRWLPGSIWSYASRAVLGKRAGLTATGASSSVALELGVTILGWVLIAGLAFPGCPEVVFPLLELLSDYSLSQTLVVVLSIGSALLVLGLLLGKIGGLRRRLESKVAAIVAVRPRLNPLCTSIGFFAVMAAFNGGTMYVYAKLLHGDAGPSLWIVLFANSIAWLVGLAAPFAPGGLVVREAAFAAILASCLPLDAALSLAISWRLFQIAAEISCMGGLALHSWGSRVRSVRRFHQQPGAHLPL